MSKVNSPGLAWGVHLMAEVRPPGVASVLASCPVVGLPLLCRLPGNALSCWSVVAAPGGPALHWGSPLCSWGLRGRAQVGGCLRAPIDLTGPWGPVQVQAGGGLRLADQPLSSPTHQKLSSPTHQKTGPTPPCTQQAVWVFTRSSALRSCTGTSGKAPSLCSPPARRGSGIGDYRDPWREIGRIWS